jgi:hypothetical protein
LRYSGNFARKSDIWKLEILGKLRSFRKCWQIYGTLDRNISHKYSENLGKEKNWEIIDTSGQERTLHFFAQAGIHDFKQRAHGQLY